MFKDNVSRFKDGRSHAFIGLQDPLENARARVAHVIDRELDASLPKLNDCYESYLFQAMRYSTLDGGKRLRPFLALCGAEMWEVPLERALPVALALEMIHSYSLIHDDLPAMDNDDLRRGKPTCHRAFSEAAAILAGDALLTLAFETVASDKTHPNGLVRCELLTGLAQASGASGMVGGQMIDLCAHMSSMNQASVSRLQAMKTGSLIAFSCESGAILAEATQSERSSMRRYGQDLGLAFQISDDILDREGKEDEAGKRLGKDCKTGKATFVALLGIEGAKRYAHQLIERAQDAIADLGVRADRFRQITHFVLDRRS